MSWTEQMQRYMSGFSLHLYLAQRNRTSTISSAPAGRQAHFYTEIQIILGQCIVNLIVARDIS